MARCAATDGAGAALVCCRLPHADGPHHWHWRAFMHGINEPHRYALRMNGHLAACGPGAELDGDS